jgi:hypothetical protein
MGEMLLDLCYSESCFLAKTHMAFWLFGWLLAFAKAEADWKSPTKQA